MRSPEPLELAGGAPVDAGERLSRETARLAGRLGELLAQALPAEGPHADGLSFLRAVHEAAAGDGGWGWRARGLDHPLDRVAEGLDLSPVEVDLLLLAGLPEEHEGFSGLLRTLHPRGEPRPSTGLAAQLFCRSAEERRLLRQALETGAAVSAGVVRLGDEGPFWERTLGIADGLWSALHGLDVWPAGAPRIAAPIASAGLRGWLDSIPARRARSVLAAGEARTVLVTADGEEVAVHRAAALCAGAGLRYVRFAFPAGGGAELERQVSLHALARGAVPVVRISAPEGPGAVEVPSFAGHPGPVVVCARAGAASVRGGRPVLELPVERLSPLARSEMWSEAIPELAEHADPLAARYTVEPEGAAAAAVDARSVAALEGREPRVEDVAASVRTRSGLALSSGVRLVRPAARWGDLVLPADRKAQLREALDRLEHQARVLGEWGFLEGRTGARGVRMLFAGISGTGKTLSAEVLAGELGVDLLLVDISRVVSKWIGETEKNLAEVFDVAERAQAVLFFDEADALFGKRTEVSDAHDRYANLETAFLLTRLERFEGLAVLSTNLRQNIDPAFVRRLEFVVEFEEPGVEERVALWRCHVPADAPLAPEVNLRELAALYPIVGGLIRNAAVAAAFLAASEGSPITRTHLVRAIRREYDKSGRAFPGLPAGVAER